MRKLSLVLTRTMANFPTVKDTGFVDVEVEVPSALDGEQLYLSSARVWNDHLTATSEAPLPGSDVDATVIRYNDIEQIVGRLLTYVDATYSDTEQRKAHKDIVKQLVYDWSNDLRTRATQEIESGLRKKQ